WPASEPSAAMLLPLLRSHDQGNRRGVNYSQAHTSMTLAAEAMSSAIVSVRYTRSQAVCSVVPMAGIFRRFYSASPGDSFFRDSGLVKDSKRLPLRSKRPISPHPPVKPRQPEGTETPGSHGR